MLKQIELVFYNRGLRSYIEVDLCRECPRQDQKGCCGFYSPVFYPSDFAFWLQNRPELVDQLFSLPHLTILDASVTLNSQIDGDSYRCGFHRQAGGCLLDQSLRESICRHFVCPGIGWELEPDLEHWKAFFNQLSDYEIKLNNQIARYYEVEGLSLRYPDQRSEFMARLPQVFKELAGTPPAFFTSCPPVEKAVIKRTLKFSKDWTL